MNRKTIIILLALVPALVVFIAPFSEELTSILHYEKQINSFEIALTYEGNGRNTYDLIEYEELQTYLTRNLYVPNYDAKIIIDVISDPLVIDENILFRINVSESGILRRENHFLFLIRQGNPSFPCFPI